MAHLLLIDGNHTVRRYFHAFGPDGPEASIGFAIGRWRRRLEPTHAVMIFDADGPTWRHREFPAYKARREERPPTFVDLLNETKRICRGWSMLTAVAPPEHEADDLIASYTDVAVGRGWRVSIISGDKDLLQLVRDEPPVQVHDEIRKVVWTPKQVEAKFGVPPAWIPDLLALIGDGSDGFPGVPGIGEKTAVPLLREFNGFDGLMDRRNLITRKSTYELIRAHADSAMTCYRLATLARNLNLPTPLRELEWTVKASGPRPAPRRTR